MSYLRKHFFLLFFQCLLSTEKSVKDCHDYTERIGNKLKEIKRDMESQTEKIQAAIKSILGRFVGKYKFLLNFSCF